MNELDGIHKYTPLWGCWNIEECLGKGSYGSVYKIVREEMGFKYYAAAKILTVPSYEQYKEATETIGTDYNSLSLYFKDAVKSIVEEIKLLYSLNGNSNIVSYYDHMVIEKTTGFGWDIIIRMELLTSLNNYISNNNLTRREIIRLGIDICSALQLCEQANIIHRDVKIENIFVSDKGVFKLGDFGIAKDLSQTGLAASIKGTPLYMAPEVYKGQPYDKTADTYSLGLVLYRLLNYGRMPFLPPYPHDIKFNDSEVAIDKRLSGNKISKPSQANDILGEIIVKACEYRKNDRYKNATELKIQLEQVLESTEESKLSEELLIPKLVFLKETKNQLSTPDNSIKDAIKVSGESITNISIINNASDESLNKTVSVYSENENINGEYIKQEDLNNTQEIIAEEVKVEITNTKDPGPNKNKSIIILSITAISVLVALTIVIIAFSSNKPNQDVDNSIAIGSQEKKVLLEEPVNTSQKAITSSESQIEETTTSNTSIGTTAQSIDVSSDTGPSTNVTNNEVSVKQDKESNKKPINSTKSNQNTVKQPQKAQSEKKNIETDNKIIEQTKAEDIINTFNLTSSRVNGITEYKVKIIMNDKCYCKVEYNDKQPFTPTKEEIVLDGLNRGDEVKITFYLKSTNKPIGTPVIKTAR